MPEENQIALSTDFVNVSSSGMVYASSTVPVGAEVISLLIWVLLTAA